MAKINIKIQDFDDLESEIIVTFTKDLDQSDIEAPLNEMFQIEMLLAEREDFGNFMQIRFFTMNTDIVEELKSKLIKLFQKSSGLNDPCLN